MACKCKDGKPCDESALSAAELDVLNRTRIEMEALKTQAKELTYKNTQLSAQVQSYLQSTDRLQRENSNQRIEMLKLQTKISQLEGLVRGPFG